VKNASQLRAPHATFDPAKRDSANLLAGQGPLPAGPLNAPQQEAAYY
jgi:hypothetical protein